MLARMSLVSSPIDGAPRQIRRESATFLAPPRRPGSARRIAGPEPAQSFRASRNVRRHTGRACCIPLRSRSWPHSTPPRPHGSCASRKLPQTPIQFPALLRIHRRRILRTDVITVLGQVQPAIRERWTLDVSLGERLDLVGLFSAGWLGRAARGPTVGPLRVCAVERRRFPVGERPTRQFAPAGSSRSSHGGDDMAEAFGMRVTNW
jgi:hypothetical protein